MMAVFILLAISALIMGLIGNSIDGRLGSYLLLLAIMTALTAVAIGYPLFYPHLFN